MQMKSLTAAASLAILGLLASGRALHIPSGDRPERRSALKQFYTLNPTNRDLIGKAPAY